VPFDHEKNWCGARGLARLGLRLIEQSREAMARSHRILNESETRIWEAEVLRRDAEDAHGKGDNQEA
jgi:hypothetical protein